MTKEEEQFQLSNDFKEAFGTDGGLRILAKLESLSTYRKSSIKSSGKIDTERLLYDEGQRAVLLYIHKQIDKILKRSK